MTLETHAEASTRAYQRATWIRFVAVFFPIPLVVLLLRLQVDAWMYYVWGALIVSVATVLYIVDSAASDKVDAAVVAAEKARQAYDEACTLPDRITPP